MPLSEHILDVLREALFLSEDATEAEVLTAICSSRAFLECLIDRYDDQGIEPELNAALNIIRARLSALVSGSEWDEPDRPQPARLH